MLAGRIAEQGVPRLSAFYERTQDGYRPLPATRGPWDPNFQHGAAMSGLLAHVLNAQPTAAPMALARFHLDILRPAPMGPVEVVCAPLRDGRRLQLMEATLRVGGEAVARASALRMRTAPTPRTPLPPAPPAPPEAVKTQDRGTLPMGGIVDWRAVRGGRWLPGPGAAWLGFHGDIVEGEPITPIVAAALACDFGSGLGSFVNWREFSYANVDITMHVVRPPADNWVLVDAESQSWGEGRALVNSVLSDRQGEFARAHQTLFIDAQK